MLILIKRKNRKIRVKIVENSILSCLLSNLLVKLNYVFKFFNKINLKSRFFFENLTFRIIFKCRDLDISSILLFIFDKLEL